MRWDVERHVTYRSCNSGSVTAWTKQLIGFEFVLLRNMWEWCEVFGTSRFMATFEWKLDTSMFVFSIDCTIALNQQLFVNGVERLYDWIPTRLTNCPCFAVFAILVWGQEHCSHWTTKQASFLFHVKTWASTAGRCTGTIPWSLERLARKTRAIRTHPFDIK